MTSKIMLIIARNGNQGTRRTELYEKGPFVLGSKLKRRCIYRLE